MNFYTLNLDYQKDIHNWHVDYPQNSARMKQEMQAAVTALREQFGEQPKVLLYGTELSGSLAYGFLQDAGIEPVATVDKNGKKNIKRFCVHPLMTPDAFDVETEIDAVFIATGPDHYLEIFQNFVSLLRSKPAVYCMFNNVHFSTSGNEDYPRVILGTLPKSGTDWMHAMLRDLLGEVHGYKLKPDLQLGTMQPRMLTASHHLYDVIEPFVANQNYKFIYLYRDFRDHLISWVHHFKYVTNNRDYELSQYLKQISDEEALYLYITGSPGRMGAQNSGIRPLRENALNVKKWVDMSAVHSNILTIKYEDLRSHTVETLSKAVQFLKLPETTPDTAIEKIVDACSFKNRSKGRKLGQEDKTSYVRKGVVGDWKNYFTPENKKLFKDSAGDILVALGYEKDFDW